MPVPVVKTVQDFFAEKFIAVIQDFCKAVRKCVVNIGILNAVQQTQ